MKTTYYSMSDKELFYYHLNHLASTMYVTDEQRSVTQSFLYAPFGEITNEHNSSFGNGVIPKYSFNAKELDEETGMYYYEARYMAPPVFTSRDVLFEEKPWLTPYHYCSNNPVVRIDPTGMMDWHPEITENGEVNYVADKGDSKESFQRQYNVSKAAVDKIFKNAGISEVKKGTRISGAIVSKSITNNTGRKYDDVLKLNWNKATKEQKVYHVMFAILCSNIRRGNEESDVIDLNEFINGLPSETGDPVNLSIKNVTIPLPDDKTMKLQLYNSSFSQKYSKIVSQPPSDFLNSDGTIAFNQTFVQYPLKGSGIPKLLVAFPSIYYDSYIKYYYK